MSDWRFFIVADSQKYDLFVSFIFFKYLFGFSRVFAVFNVFFFYIYFIFLKIVRVAQQIANDFVIIFSQKLLSLTDVQSIYIYIYNYNMFTKIHYYEVFISVKINVKCNPLCSIKYNTVHFKIKPRKNIRLHQKII